MTSIGLRPFAIPSHWGLAEALARQPGLSLVPGEHADVRIEGELRVQAVGPTGVPVDERYFVDIHVPRSFPRRLPRVVETGKRIPHDFHHLANGSLCLGSPTAQKLAIEPDPTVGGFIDRVVVPYLYGHAYFTQFRTMPYGELTHGAAGLEEDLCRLFGLPLRSSADELLRLAGMRRRHANKRPCPCGSRICVGRCHGAAVHEARRRLGRAWCREQLMLLQHQRASECRG